MRRSKRVRMTGSAAGGNSQTCGIWKLISVFVILGLSSQTAHSSPINRQVGISENVFITVQNDTYGNEQRVCSIDSVTYEDGDSIPTSSPCEHCICRPPGFACTIISCEYRPGCKALKRSNQCCPEYQCECEKDGKIYQNGEKILDNNNPCEVCYCQGGDVICAVIDCYWRSDCQPRYIENRCCPLYDHCPPPSHPGPLRPVQSTTTRPTTLAAVFPWGNTSSSTIGSVPVGSHVDFTTSKPVVPLSTPAAIQAEMPSAPIQESLTIPSPAHPNEHLQNDKLSTESPEETVTPSNVPVPAEGQPVPDPIDSSSQSHASQATVSSDVIGNHVSEAGTGPVSAEESFPPVVGPDEDAEIKPGSQHSSSQSAEDTETQNPVENGIVEGDASVHTVNAIAPQTTGSDETVEIIPSTSLNELELTATPSEELLPEVEGTAIVSAAGEQLSVSVEPSSLETNALAHDTDRISNVEPTHVLQSEGGSLSDSIVLSSTSLVEPAEAGIINPSVTATSVVDSVVEPTLLLPTIPVGVSQNDAAAATTTEQIYGDKPVEQHTELPAIEINSSPDPENRQPTSSELESAAFQGTIEEKQPLKPLGLDPNSAAELKPPSNAVTDSQSDLNAKDQPTETLPLAPTESKPLLHHDIIIDPTDTQNDLPAILSQQKPAGSEESGGSSGTSVSEDSVQTTPNESTTNAGIVSDDPIVPVSAPVAGGNVIQLLPGSTDSPVQTDNDHNDDHTAPSVTQDKLDDVNKGVLSDDVDAISSELETTNRVPTLSQENSSHSNIPSVSDESIAHDREAPSVEETTKQLLLSDSFETDQGVTTNRLELIHDPAPTQSHSGVVPLIPNEPALADEVVVLTTNGPEQSAEVVQDAVPNGDAQTTESSPIEDLSEPQTTVPNLVELPALDDSQAHEPVLVPSAELNKEPLQTTNVPLSVGQDEIESTAVPVSDQVSEDEVAKDGEESKFPDGHITVVNDEPVVTTSTPEEVNDDVVGNNKGTNELTTAKSVQYEEAARLDLLGDELEAATTTTQPEASDKLISNDGVSEPRLEQEQTTEEIPLKLRLDPSVFASLEQSSSSIEETENPKIAELTTSAVPEIVPNNDEAEVTTTVIPLLRARQEPATTEPYEPTTENDLVFDVGSTSSSAQANELRSEPVHNSEESTDTTTGLPTFRAEEIRDGIDRVEQSSVPQEEQNVERTTVASISLGRSDLDSIEFSSSGEEAPAGPQQVTGSIGFTNSESDSESATTIGEILVNDEKVEGDNVVSTTPPTTFLLRHHHPDHEGFLLEKTTRKAQFQQSQEDEVDDKTESSPTLFRTLEVTTVNEPEVEDAEGTTVSSNLGFRSDVVDDTTTIPPALAALSSEKERSDSPNVPPSISKDERSDATERNFSHDEVAQSTSFSVLEEDDGGVATTVQAPIFDEVASTSKSGLYRLGLSEDEVEALQTTSALPLELLDATEVETRASLDDVEADTTTTQLELLDSVENETERNEPTASPFTDNNVRPELARRPDPFSDDLSDNIVGRSDLSLQGQLKEEVNSADDNWFWKTVNRVRRLPDFFSVLSRKPRASGTTKPEGEKPLKTKKPTNVEPKPKRIAFRPFLFW